MEVKIKVPERLAEAARARGVSVEVYVEEILAQQALTAPGVQPQESVREAIESILRLRKGKKLAGLQTKDLVHEGRKY